MKFLIMLFCSSLLFPFAALAASGETHSETQIPWGTIGQQIFNLSIVVIGLSFLLRKKIATYFSERKKEFNQLIQKAEAAKASAEKSKREISQRLEKLESESQDSIQQAKEEAEDLKSRILKEAAALSEKLETEAAKSAKFEVERAKLQLRSELLETSIDKSKESLTSEIDESEKKILHEQFIQKLQVTQ